MNPHFNMLGVSVLLTAQLSMEKKLHRNTYKSHINIFLIGEICFKCGSKHIVAE